MLKFPNISPTIFQIGIFEIRWYGLFYAISFIIGYIFLKKLLQKKNIFLNDKIYENFIFSLLLGVILGGRLGYVLFYNLAYYLENPIKIFATWEGGMSFHGGAIGVIIFGIIFVRKNKLSFYKLADCTMPFVAIGLGLGRIGNFINAELYGKPTNMPWGMIFPNSDNLPRHPSQIYEALLEGLLLFIISYIICKKTKTDGLGFWSFIGLYGIFRFFVEFFRQPDSQIGYFFQYITMGQILSSFMVIFSVFFIIILLKKINEKKYSYNYFIIISFILCCK